MLPPSATCTAQAIDQIVIPVEIEPGDFVCARPMPQVTGYVVRHGSVARGKLPGYWISTPWGSKREDFIPDKDIELVALSDEHFARYAEQLRAELARRGWTPPPLPTYDGIGVKQRGPQYRHWEAILSDDNLRRRVGPYLYDDPAPRGAPRTQPFELLDLVEYQRTNHLRTPRRLRAAEEPIRTYLDWCHAVVVGVLPTGIVVYSAETRLLMLPSDQLGASGLRHVAKKERAQPIG